MSAGRLDRLRARLSKASLDALVVHRVVNVRYLTRFAGVFDAGFPGLLAVSAERAVLVTDFRYEQQLAACAKDGEIEIRSIGGEHVEALAGLLADPGFARAGIEDSVSVAQKASIEKACGRRLEATSGMVEALRAIKEPEEIKAIARAVRLTDEAFTEALPTVRAGASTREVALAIEWHMRTHGGQAAAFGLIVAAGARSAMPHATTIEQVIEPGDFVKIDIGAVVDDYCSDMTRTVVVGKASERQRRMYEAVCEAQARALEGIRAGTTGREADALARDELKRAGFGENFGHGLGHGVGLEVHERPRLAHASEDVLEEGMVVTVEPGVYVPGFGGVRIEDLVVVEAGGVRNLTSSPKELLVV